MLGVLTGFSIIAFVVLVGYVVGRFEIAGPHALPAINRLAFFVATPALLFHILADADIHAVFSAPLLVAVISALSVAVAFVLLARLVFKRRLTQTIVGALASGYLNANNIGLPVAVYVLGDASFVAPVLMFQLLLFAPVALSILDMANGGKRSVGTIVMQPFRNPMIIASLAGIAIALSGWTVPEPVMQPFQLVGGAAVPLVLMAFGMSLYGSRPLKAGTGRRDVLLASVLKVVVMPIVAYLLARFWFGFTDHELFVVVVLAALPTAQNVYNFASRYNTGVVIARDTVLLTSLAAIPIIVVIAALLA